MRSTISQQSSTVAVIEPDGTALDIGIDALWKRRELVFMLAMRSIRVRFRDTSLGIMWAFAQPLLYMLVINTFFGLIVRFDTGDVPYPLHLLTGLIAFQLFTKSVSEGTGAILGSRDILQKIYVPPVVFPAASLLSSLIDFLFPAVLIVLFLAYYGVAPTSNLSYLPLALLWLVVLCAAAQIAMSALAVRFADIRFLVPVVTQLLFFATPIFYPISIIPKTYHLAYGLLNPMAGVIEFLRWCVLGLNQPPNMSLVLVSTASTVIVVTASIVIFRLIARSLHRYL